jgi:uncharacterized coiled-coil protein SlyX
VELLEVVTEERASDLENRTSRIEGVVEQINLRLEDQISRMDSIEIRMGSLESSLNARMASLESGLNARMDSLESGLNARMGSIEARMNVQIALTFAMWATIVGALVAVLLRV